ncbi:MAG: hypothetical protein QM270_11065 [Bacillota bacterium]|nr:hypothetical protein [Bacillota bacterium]
MDALAYDAAGESIFPSAAVAGKMLFFNDRADRNAGKKSPAQNANDKDPARDLTRLERGLLRCGFLSAYEYGAQTSVCAQLLFRGQLEKVEHLLFAGLSPDMAGVKGCIRIFAHSGLSAGCS